MNPLAISIGCRKTRLHKICSMVVWYLLYQRRHHNSLRILASYLIMLQEEATWSWVELYMDTIDLLLVQDPQSN